MIELIRSRLGRPTLFVATGVAIGALLAPWSGGSGAQGVTTYTRAVSCSGFGFLPITSTDTYQSSGTQRTGSDGYFVCPVDLPHKAVVTRVRFTLRDQHPSGGVDDCALVRGGLTVATAASAQVMAKVPDTVGNETTNPGIQRMTDTTINFATVDNTNFHYYLQCFIAAGGGQLLVGVYGADVTFKITAGNG